MLFVEAVTGIYPSLYRGCGSKWEKRRAKARRATKESNLRCASRRKKPFCNRCNLTHLPLSTSHSYCTAAVLYPTIGHMYTLYPSIIIRPWPNPNHRSMHPSARRHQPTVCAWTLIISAFHLDKPSLSEIEQSSLNAAFPDFKKRHHTIIPAQLNQAHRQTSQPPPDP